MICFWIDRVRVYKDTKIKGLYSTANDPEPTNDLQNGPQMILDRKWSPKSTANDPERKLGMTWTQVILADHRVDFIIITISQIKS